MIETWTIIVIAVLVAVGLLQFSRNIWKRWKRQYFSDNENDGADAVDIEALEFTIEEEDVVASRDMNRDVSEIDVTTPRLTRTNSF
mmetsp:Transcript_25117/g.42412  ORF Transcript_25117/g.42412 Transcript_25117/m.42412 type:complete len:86 (+) Transcript_25117:223-480(+)|eukprot:CAMPEP_0114449454 /NCGR_PEP_ID=MMETSP0103-20121206/20872_1 /TAXON_ID=37642 ORGANISM="Paraphysomonas imperforata, Strain PA2" /NCGR_SAMPLE_ID=MMETSP0103 /ASSEMBLY_ACC=CAM_ASM_000201 /LENGTH=85 /DNA_ID=CAMNT_0001621547 /DNA_START=129 /DNA_END=386 /DNA_ORIENTATION=-